MPVRLAGAVTVAVAVGICNGLQLRARRVVSRVRHAIGQVAELEPSTSWPLAGTDRASNRLLRTGAERVRRLAAR